jgi:Beta-ketoacyl synthase, N-terminal domain
MHSDLVVIAVQSYFQKYKSMFYIHHTVCISPQISSPKADLEQLFIHGENKMYAKEIPYDDIPPALLRRMGKAVKLGVAAAMPLFKMNDKIDGILIGTANGGMEDCIKFLNQVIEYDEGRLTPTNFVQSTTNAIAGQLGFLSKNKGYNITHVHRGLAFENTLIDVDMLLADNPEHTYLIGGLDEISEYNFNLDTLTGAFKDAFTDNDKLYSTKTKGTIAGEGVAMYLVNKNKQDASSAFRAIKTIHTRDVNEVLSVMKEFIKNNLTENESIDLFLSGENGDIRYDNYYETCESAMAENVDVARFKHMSGEYATSSAFALWLADEILRTQHIPKHMLKKDMNKKEIKTILIYNNYQGLQHGFMLLSKI